MFRKGYRENFGGDLAICFRFKKLAYEARLGIPGASVAAGRRFAQARYRGGLAPREGSKV